jgi:acyl-coenzyme A synthetase/AMP-(fatty) acid ligase
MSPVSNSLIAAGVGLGDRVAACMPNTWQTLVAMLATTSLGRSGPVLRRTSAPKA